MGENKNDLFNWYETKAMKKLIGEKDNYDYSKTGIHPDSRILCCGMTGSGKTMALLHYIRLSPNLYSRVIVFYKESEKLYELLNQGLGGKVEFHSQLSELPTLKKIREGMNEKERILLILDDWVLELKNYPNVNDYFIMGRKKNCTLFLLSQDYYRIPIPLRNQMTYLLLFKMAQKRDIDSILSQYDNKEKQLLPYYKEITSKPNNFMKITTSNCNDNEKISRNFIDYLPFKT